MEYTLLRFHPYRAPQVIPELLPFLITPHWRGNKGVRPKEPLLKAIPCVFRAGGVIGTSWAAEKEWQNGVIFVQTSLNVDLSGLQHLGNMSFRKVFAGGEVTFSCTGKQIVYTGDNAFNGGDGSTAVVSIYGNKCYIDIRNI